MAVWKFRSVYIGKRQSDLAISRGFLFHKTSHISIYAKFRENITLAEISEFTVFQA